MNKCGFCFLYCCNERRFQVGYNAEEIRVFIPKELRKLAECHDMDRCPQFSNKDCLNFKTDGFSCINLIKSLIFIESMSISFSLIILLLLEK